MLEDSQFKTGIFFPILDLILRAMDDRFNKCEHIINAVSVFHPESAVFLKYECVEPLMK
jgi:hypothetical protein